MSAIWIGTTRSATTTTKSQSRPGNSSQANAYAASAATAIGRKVAPSAIQSVVHSAPVIAEFWLRGTHEGSFRGLPATGRSFECRMAALFLFDEDRLVCERVYFDAGTILRQLGIAHDPTSVTGRVATVANHPLTIGRGLVRSVLRR